MNPGPRGAGSRWKRWEAAKLDGVARQAGQVASCKGIPFVFWNPEQSRSSHAKQLLQPAPMCLLSPKHPACLWNGPFPDLTSLCLAPELFALVAKPTERGGEIQDMQQGRRCAAAGRISWLALLGEVGSAPPPPGAPERGGPHPQGDGWRSLELQTRQRTWRSREEEARCLVWSPASNPLSPHLLDN